MQTRKRYEERLLEDMASPFWQLAVGDAPPILQLPWELLAYIVEILVGDRGGENMKAVRSLRCVNRRFAQITSSLALSSISLVVKPSRLSAGLFWLSRNPSIMNWCTTLHLMLQNSYYLVRAPYSTAPQDHIQSQIITLLPRLSTLRIYVKLLAYRYAVQTMYNETVSALTSLKHIEDISFTINSERTTYSTQVLRVFASSIRHLRINGWDTDWFIGDQHFLEYHPFLDGNCNIVRPWSFPNLRSLELRNVSRERDIYAQIPLDTPLVTLVLSFDTVLRPPFTSPLPPRRVHRLVLWVSRLGIHSNPRFEHGLSADMLDLMVPIEPTDDPPLIRTFERLAEFTHNLSGDITRKVTWKVECSTPELRTKVKGALQEPLLIATFQSLAAACHDQGLQWELEGLD